MMIWSSSQEHSPPSPHRRHHHHYHAWSSLLVVLLVAATSPRVASAASSTKAYYKNCGEDPKSSINEIHGCNLQLEEEQACSFSDYYDSTTAGSTSSTTPETEESLSLTLARPIQSNDNRMVTLYYYTCTVQTAAASNNDCTNVETVFLYGNAVARIDDMLIQRQPQPQSSQSTQQQQAIATTTTTTPPPTNELEDDDDRICFVWDHFDGNAPLASSKNDCQYKCVTLTQNNLGSEEIILNTDTSHSYYGSVTRNRHVTIVETGIRSSSASATTIASLLGIGIGIGTIIIFLT